MFSFDPTILIAVPIQYSIAGISFTIPDFKGAQVRDIR